MCFSAALKSSRCRGGNNIGHNNDNSSVERFFSIKRHKVRKVVRHKCVLLLPNHSHELPIFQPTKASVGDVIRGVTCRMRNGHKRCVEALVNQKFHFGLAIRLRWRVVRTAFRFAKGREAGRPRRGKA